MLRPFLVLGLIALSHQGPVVTEDEAKIRACTPGYSWVDNYIKYQCFEDEGSKGIAVVGCAPKNDMTSEVLLPWQTYTTCNFKYVCEMNSTHASYKVKTCMDRTGAVLKVGQSRTFDDGESVTCFKENEKIRIRITTKQGCIVGKAIYAEGHTWIEQTADTVTVASKTVTVSAGVSWQCKKDTSGSFFSQALACLSAENKYILPEAFGMVNGIVVKCTLIKESIWKLEVATDAEISCSVNGNRVSNGYEWKASDGRTGYVCHFGVVIKRSCLINGEEIPLHATRYVDDKAYYCHAGEGVFAFGNLLGCTLADGRIIQFEKTFYDGDRIMKCSFNFTSHNTAVSQTEQVGCLYNREEISKNAMQLINGHYIYCARKGEVYIARQLTAQEIAIWLKMGEQSYSRELDGVEGAGTGAQYNKPTTTTTTTTQKPTTTTRKPTTTTTTTQRPTTTTTSTTTTSKPTTTTHITTTSTTTTHITTTSTTTTPKPIATKAPLPILTCKDYMEPEICARLAPLCMSTAAKVEEIKKIINHSVKSKEDKERVAVLLSTLGVDTSGEEPMSLTSLFGEEAVDQPADKCGGCTSCAKKIGSTCNLKRRIIRDLVRYTCPNTCGCPAGYTSSRFVTLLLNDNGCKCKCC